MTTSTDAVASTLMHLPARSVHAATAILLVQLLQEGPTAAAGVQQQAGAARWKLVPPLPADWTQSSTEVAAVPPPVAASSGSSTLCWRCRLFDADSNSLLHLTMLPLFGSLVVRMSLLPLSSPPASLSDPVAIDASEATSSSAAVQLPPVTITDVALRWSGLPPAAGGGASAAGFPANGAMDGLASLPADVLSHARNSLDSRFFNFGRAATRPVPSAWDHIEAARLRVKRCSVEETLLRGFIDHMLLQLQQPQQEQQQQSQQPETSQQAIPHPTLLVFPQEAAVSVQSACLGLLHLLLVYEGFIPCGNAAPASSPAADAASSTVAAPSLLPAGWASFTSTQSVYTLRYQHSALLRSLPAHVVVFKVASLFGTAMAIHAQLLTEGDAAASAGQSAPFAAASSSPVPPASAPAPIFSLTLRPADVLQPGVVGQSADALRSATAATLFRGLGSVFSQLRNRVLKHMLGAQYRDASSDDRSISPLLRLPAEILLSVLQLLPSSGVVAVGNTCWSLMYASQHPLVWEQLCERELPLGPAASASTASAAEHAEPAAAATASPHTPAEPTSSPPAAPAPSIRDWRAVYLARLQLRDQSRREAAARALASLSRFPPSGGFGIWGPPFWGGGGFPFRPNGGGFAGDGRYHFPPPPVPYHPWFREPHPDAPFFPLPGVRR